VREHGKNSTYVNGKCRCQPCREAHAAAKRHAYKPRPKRVAVLPVLDHERQQLVEAYLHCAVDGARSAMRRHGSRFDYQDLLSVAHVGLVRAASTWVDGKGSTFSTWSFFWINKLLRRFVHDDMRANGYVWVSGGRHLIKVAAIDQWPVDDDGVPYELMQRDGKSRWVRNTVASES
jgi:DNA-directed RNA polymerase specialized sigma24 family protein